MKVAVLGANGFVGRNLTAYLQMTHDVVPVFRQTLDLLDPLAVVRFLEENKFDVIVNAAAIMTDAESFKDTRNNLGIFMNFYDNSHLFNKFINLASGAEYDRTMDINCIEEKEIFNRLPKDSYGFGQNIKSRLSFYRDNFYNIRIFNCFGPGEYDTRIFSRFLKQQNLVITNDRYFDYFGIQDLCLLVDHCILNHWIVKDLNAVYKDKYLISQILDMFCTVNNLPKNFDIVSTSQNNYTGSALNLYSLNLTLNGLEHGFQKYILREKNGCL